MLGTAFLVSNMASRSLYFKCDFKRSQWASSLTRETVPIKKHLFPKLWLCHNIKRKKISFSPFENWIVLYLKKILFHLHKDMQCTKFLLKLVQWFCRRRFSKYGIYEKFEQTRISFAQQWYMPNLVEIGLVVLEWKKNLNFAKVFSLYRYTISLWKRSRHFIGTSRTFDSNTGDLSSIPGLHTP